MWDLRGQRGRDGDEVALAAAVVHGHLPAAAGVAGIAVALSHEEVQGVPPVHQHPCGGGNGERKKEPPPIFGYFPSEQERIRPVGGARPHPPRGTARTPGRCRPAPPRCPRASPPRHSWSYRRKCGPGGGTRGSGGHKSGCAPPLSPPPAPQLAPYLPLGLVEDAVHGVEERHGLVELQHQLLGQLWGTRVSHACLGCRRWGCGACRVSRGRLLGAGGVRPIGVTRVRRHRDGCNTLGTWSWHVWGVTYIYVACLRRNIHLRGTFGV